MNWSLWGLNWVPVISLPAIKSDLWYFLATHWASITPRFCRSLTWFIRTSMCALRLFTSKVLTIITAERQSTKIVVGPSCSKPSSLRSCRALWVALLAVDRPTYSASVADRLTQSVCIFVWTEHGPPFIPIHRKCPSWDRLDSQWMLKEASTKQYRIEPSSEP